MNVLVVGGGGREHAIVEALHRSHADIFAAMANQNPGIRRRSKDVLLGDVTAVERIVSWAKERAVDLAVIGPERRSRRGSRMRLKPRGSRPSARRARQPSSKRTKRSRGSSCDAKRSRDARSFGPSMTSEDSKSS